MEFTPDEASQKQPRQNHLRVTQSLVNPHIHRVDFK
jgi:hypothetical protein